jgi:hypothetical protein
VASEQRAVGSKKTGVKAMIRSIVVYLLITALLPTVFSVDAQQLAKVPRIGFVGSGNPSTPGREVEVFRQGLRDLGYIEKKSIAAEYRYTEGRLERLPLWPNS